MNFFLGWGDEILLAITVTIRVALGALALGLLWGILVATAKLSRYKLIRMFGDLFTTVVRGVPELVIVLIVYFGGTITITNILRYWNPDVVYFEVPPIAAGIFALSLVFGGYSAEVFRGAISSVQVGQIEAAKAVGMTSWMIFRRIKLPLMWRIALPGIGNLWISLVKNTSLISIVGLEEIMRVSSMANATTHKPFRFYAIAILIYLILAILNTQGLQRLESRANRGFRKVV